MTEMLELFGKGFKAAIIKLLQLAIMSRIEANENNRKSQCLSKASSRRYKKEPNRNFRTEKQSKIFKKTTLGVPV